MYAAFFGLHQEAFSIAPDPRFLYMSAMHREALAHLLYGLSAGGGFVLLTGDIGAGKTTVCRAFLEQIPPGHRVAYVVNPKLSAAELLLTVNEEFGIDVDAAGGTKALVDALNRFLLAEHAAGRNCLLVIDEAQGLAPEVLEQLRLLTNLETAERKLLQIVLIGQPELRTMLARPELEQLAQRVVARVHLGPLSAAETVDYVNHRLAIAGWQGESPFDARALALLHAASGGVPRRINLLAQRALLGAYAQGTRRIGRDTVAQAMREVFDDEAAARRRTLRRAGATAGVAAAVAAVAVIAWAWPRTGVAPRGAAAPVPASGATTAATRPARGAATSTAATSAVAASATAATALPAPFASEDDAWRALAAAWSLELPVNAQPCTAARAFGLACHHGSGDWALLRKLDRPALLLLDGGAFVLEGSGEQRAVLRGSSGSVVVGVERVDAVWNGRYAVWWRPPPAWRDDGAARPNAALADDVLARLTALQGEARTPASRDEALRQRVFAFQVAQGLALDGVAGPLTLMQLNRASGVDEPRLRKDPH